MKNIEIIEEKIKYKFNDRSWIVLALTHTSYNNYKPNNQFERLEFLGDRVLGLAISEILHNNFKTENEGDLAKRLSALVNGETLLKVAKDLKIDQFIKVAPNINFEADKNKSILSDAMESLIGAIFLDSNYSCVKEFIKVTWENYILNYKIPPKDSKSVLQEWTLANNYGIPVYSNYQKSGKDHNHTFKVKLKIKKMPVITGIGSSKKIAEMDAAKKVMDLLNKEIKNNE